ncbi:hypothetical protein [Spiroplasma taiwanense]|uniref:Transmembrane protein n=1 Tax=Spiroplasma taiwanense CT-1 TaxID=1276220 RepID=S5LWZ3_9MOLU|nr:hypothetical protein [Spiroplasma taiwanense]AGR41156.1 hypothetical protein STAIW_v1c05270 [Spiroplasma taiwanense CT-1]
MNFVIFLIFTFSLQSTTIICTLLLAFSFIANLPTTFNEQKEERLRLGVNYNGENPLYYVPDIYETFDLQKNVNEGKIRYKYLSKYINDFFISNSFSFATFNDDESIIAQRIDYLWGINGLGITRTEPYSFSTFSGRLNSIPNDYADFDTFSDVTISISLNNTFISLDELKVRIDSSINIDQKNVLNDLYNFKNEIVKEIGGSSSTDSNQWPRIFQQQKNELLKDFIFINKATMTQANNEIDLGKDDIDSIYKYELVGRNNSNTLTLESGIADNFVNEMYFSLLFASRILEQYFIDYTSRYIILTESQINKTDTDWNKYVNSRKVLNGTLFVNLFSQLLTSYTLYSGFSYDDFWFDVFSTSKIEFEAQKNLFLAYPQYTFKLNSEEVIEKDTYNNYINPIYYIIILFIFALFCLIYAVAKFNLINFK